MISETVTINAETYAVVLEKENLGEPHPTIVGGEYWYPKGARHERDVRVLAQLREQGLTSNNRVSDDFMDVLAAMQKPAIEYYTLARFAEEDNATYRAAAVGRDAVLITCVGMEITIEPIPFDQMRMRLAAALPTVPAARMHSATCPVSELQALHGGKKPDSSTSLRDAKRIMEWLELPEQARGPLHVAARGMQQERRASPKPHPLWLDTEHGRILSSHDGNGWMSVSGAGISDIADALGKLEQQLV